MAFEYNRAKAYTGAETFLKPTAGVYTGAGGSLVVVMVADKGNLSTQTTFANAQAGIILPLKVIRVVSAPAGTIFLFDRPESSTPMEY